MAVQEEKGWQWTGQEKQWIFTWKRDLQNQEKQVAEQVERFKAVLPEFADEAIRTGGAFLEAAGRLLSFAENAKDRKYQRLSPDQPRQLWRMHGGCAPSGQLLQRVPMYAMPSMRLTDELKHITVKPRSSDKPTDETFKSFWIVRNSRSEQTATLPRWWRKQQR